MTDVAATDRHDEFEQYRNELNGYCYRMLGSAFEAEDAVQETLVRAWRSLDSFEGRSSLRSWLYRIATNVCFDMLTGRQRRARPVDLSPVGSIEAPLVNRPENTWIEPIPDSHVLAAASDPAEIAVARESIRLAFVAALQLLPPRQRAVLILREVLRWQATEVAELLDTTVISVNSALQRARATLAESNVDTDPPADPDDDEQRELLARYVDAFERYDIESLVSLLREDAVFSMPPYELWLRGPVDALKWMLGPGADCRGSRLVPVHANGSAAFGQWKPGGPEGFTPWSVNVVEMSGGRITALTFFLDTNLFPLFGLHEPPAQ
jgi:RNA polymerase sigma-70 factor, ECF subfamily